MHDVAIQKIPIPVDPYALIGSGSIFLKDYGERGTRSGIADIDRELLVNRFLTSNEYREIIYALLMYRGIGYRSIIPENLIHFDLPPIEDIEVEDLTSTKDQLNLIIEWLSPGGMSGVAQLLHVSRPTIYKWLEDAIEIKSENQERLAQIFNIAKTWQKRAGKPMLHGTIRRLLPSGSTLFDILNLDEIDMGAAEEAIEVLARSFLRSQNAIDILEAAILNSKDNPD